MNITIFKLQQLIGNSIIPRALWFNIIFPRFYISPSLLQPWEKAVKNKCMLNYTFWFSIPNWSLPKGKRYDYIEDQ